jgi:hypothetical protein
MMAYTPELSPPSSGQAQEASGVLRRVAWAAGLPMTAAIILKVVPEAPTAGKICESCRDKSFCGRCSFGGVD